MKRNLISMLVGLSMAATCTTFMLPAAVSGDTGVVYEQNFEGLNVGDEFGTSNDSKAVKTYVKGDSANKYAQLGGDNNSAWGGTAIANNWDITGTATIEMRLAHRDKSSFSVIVNGDAGTIADLTCYRCSVGTSLGTPGLTISSYDHDSRYSSGMRTYFLRTANSVKSGNDYTVNTVYGLCNTWVFESDKVTTQWDYVKFVIRPSTKKFDVYMSEKSVTSDMIADHTDLIGYVEGMDFSDGASSSIKGLSTYGSWETDKNINIMYDDIKVTETDPSAPTYSVKNLGVTCNGTSVGVSADITKGGQNSAVVCALYDEGEHLIGINVDNDIMGSSTAAGAKVQYSKTLSAGTDVRYAKILLWDMSALMPVSGAAGVSVTPTPAPTIDPNDTSDIASVPYVFADVERPAVVQSVAAADIKPIPTSLANTVYRTYPDGKMKAFLLSFDDGPSGKDRTVLMPLLNNNNLTAAFNLVLKTDLVNQTLEWADADGNTQWIKDWTSDNFKNNVASVYNNYEVGNHGTHHWQLSYLNKDKLREETGLNKYNIETIFGNECPSYINSWTDSITKDADAASAVWRMAYLKYIGVRYVRNAPMKNVDWAYKPNFFNYDVPTDFYNWNPTDCITRAPICTDSTTDSSNPVDYYNKDLVQYLVDTDFGKTWKVMFGWGHATDVSGGNAGQYPALTETCQTAGAHLDVLWNPTPLQFVDYVNASRLTEVTADGESITVHNPSAVIDVWMNIKGENVKIPAGGTVVK